MGWKYAMYGTDQPSRQRAWVTNFFYLFLVLCFYGLFTRFVPSDEWRSHSFWLSLAFATFFFSLHAWSIYKGRTKLRPSKLWKRVLAYLAAPIILWVFCWISICFGAASIFTQFMGEKDVYSEYFEVTRASPGRQPSRWWCRYRVRGDAFENALLGRVCSKVRVTSEQRIPVLLEISGKRTFLGFHVQDIRESTITLQ